MKMRCLLHRCCFIIFEDNFSLLFSEREMRMLFYLSIVFLFLISCLLGEVESVEGVNWAYTSPHLIGFDIGSPEYKVHEEASVTIVNNINNNVIFKHLESCSNCISYIHSQW
jgi:hypothetical protein